MVRAYIMITVAIGYLHDILEILSSYDSIKLVETVSGPCDLIITVDMHDLHELKEFILVDLSSIDGIMECSTSLVIEP